MTFSGQIRTLLDPRTAVSGLTGDELETLDIDGDVLPQGLKPPFYAHVMFFDTSSRDMDPPEEQQDYDTYFGPYRCMQEANDAVTLLAHDVYDSAYNTYYNGHASETMWKTYRDPDLKLLTMSPVDSRFFLEVKTVHQLPDDLDRSEIEPYSIMNQAWDIYVVTCTILGPGRSGVHELKVDSRMMRVGLTLNNANKNAASMFMFVTKNLMTLKHRNACLRQITILADSSRPLKNGTQWEYHHQWTSTRWSKTMSNPPQTTIHVSVARLETDP